MHDARRTTFDAGAAASTLAFCQEVGLLSAAESSEVLALFDLDFPFADALAAAATMHVHIKVADTAAAPHEAIRGYEPTAESETEGYVKYPFPGSVNMIFSSIDIAEDDLLRGEPAAALPVMDHVGHTLPVGRPAARPAARTRHLWRRS